MHALCVRVLPSILGLGVLCVAAAIPQVAHGQAQPLPMSQVTGFRLERYEATTAGSPLFLADRPWFAPQQRFAAALTLGYAHRPLQFSDGSGPLPAIVEHALQGSLDVAGAPLRWLLLRASLPITLLERGTTDARAGIAPLEGATIGDPRLGAVFALWKQPEQSPFSLHVSLDAWIPAGSAYVTHQGDSGPRVLPRFILAGTLPHALRWTVNAGFLYRSDAVLGTDARSIRAGSEVQLAAALGYVTAAERLHIALEGLFAARVTRLDSGSQDVLRGQLMLSAQLQVGSMLHVGAAVGSDFATPGTPDARGLLRIAISPRRLAASPTAASPDSAADSPALVPTSPLPSTATPERTSPPIGKSPAVGPSKPDVTAKPSAVPTAASTAVPAAAATNAPPGDDADGDGISDAADRCPYEPETKNGIRDDDGCPESPLALQAARALRFQAPAASVLPSSPTATSAAAVSSSGPASGSAGTQGGVLAGAAPTEPSASRPASPAALPASAASAIAVAATEDSDKDGIPDEEDRCPISAEDKDSFEDEDGCPDPDNDEDGILDAQDRCPLEAETQNGYEDEDGCPDIAPANALQVQVSAAGDRIEVNQQVQFQRRQVAVAPASHALLRAVAKILRRYPKASLEVQGHTDSGGDPARNLALSQQRADSVRAFLIKEGIAAERLAARGYGATQPRFPNTTPEGRARNRRVEFVLQGDQK